MWKRTLLVVALALAVGACRAPVLAASTIAGIGDVRVVGVRFVPTTDAGPGLPSGSLTYVVAQVELVNDTAHDFTPQINRFILTAADHQRYQGIDSGSSVLVGTSNAHRMLKQGDKRLYTVAFRAGDPVIAGTISYEP
jgi:hypothetical protein